MFIWVQLRSNAFRCMPIYFQERICTLLNAPPWRETFKCVRGMREDFNPLSNTIAMHKNGNKRVYRSVQEFSLSFPEWCYFRSVSFVCIFLSSVTTDGKYSFIGMCNLRSAAVVFVLLHPFWVQFRLTWCCCVRMSATSFCYVRAFLTLLAT